MDCNFLFWIICIASIVFTFEIACIVTPFLNSFCYKLAEIVFCTIVGHWLFLFTQGSIFKKRVHSDKKAVFITGCDSGFGFQLAKLLDLKGYKVFAGCLFPKTGGSVELKNACSSRFSIVPIDVTQDDSVQDAKEFVEKNLGDCEMWAIVNNAGIYKNFSVEFAPISYFMDSLQVNTLGQVRVTKAFLPLLKQSKGRIVNVNSLAGRGSLPFTSSYTMSKYASVAFTESLRREIDALGIKVISIEPEFFKTPMTDTENLKKLMETTRASMEESFNSTYGKELLERMHFLYTHFAKIISPNVHNVIKDMEAAVSMQHPCLVYQPCGNIIRKIIVHTLGMLPDHIFDTFCKICLALLPLLKFL